MLNIDESYKSYIYDVHIISKFDIIYDLSKHNVIVG